MHEALRETFTTAINGIVADIRQEKASRLKTVDQVLTELKQQYLERRFYSLGRAFLSDIKETFRPSEEVVQKWQESETHFPDQQPSQRLIYLQRLAEGMGIYEDYSDPFYRTPLNMIRQDSALNAEADNRFFTPPAELFAFSMRLITRGETPPIELQRYICLTPTLDGVIDLNRVYGPISNWICLKQTQDIQLAQPDSPPINIQG